MDLVLEVEALRPDPRAARPHLDLLGGAKLRAEVDLDPGQDELREAAERLDPRLLEKGRVDRVVDVSHRVAIAPAHALAAHPRPITHSRDARRVSVLPIRGASARNSDVIAILGGLGAALSWAVTALTAARSSRLIGSSSTLAWVMLTGLVVVGPFALAEGRPDGLRRPRARLARARRRGQHRRAAVRLHRPPPRQGRRRLPDLVGRGSRGRPARRRGRRAPRCRDGRRARRHRRRRRDGRAAARRARGRAGARPARGTARRRGRPRVRRRPVCHRPGEPRAADLVGGPAAPPARRPLRDDPARRPRAAAADPRGGALRRRRRARRGDRLRLVRARCQARDRGRRRPRLAVRRAGSDRRRALLPRAVAQDEHRRRDRDLRRRRGRQRALRPPSTSRASPAGAPRTRTSART